MVSWKDSSDLAKLGSYRPIPKKIDSNPYCLKLYNEISLPNC